MTEKEKMMAKKLYDANYDETLNKERMEAKDLCYEYNQLRPSDEKNQKQILKNCWVKQEKTSVLQHRFGATTDTILRLGRIFIPIIIW